MAAVVRLIELVCLPQLYDSAAVRADVRRLLEVRIQCRGHVRGVVLSARA